MEVCYNITCIWLRILDEIIILSFWEYLEQSLRDIVMKKYPANDVFAG